MRDLCVILNPRAGRGQADRRRDELTATLHAAGLDFELIVTRAPGDATIQARQAVARGVQRLAVVGGDGTISEVAHALLTSEAAPPLGIIPIGTGNDFIRSLPGIKPNDLTGAVARLCRHQPQLIDAGRVTISTDTAQSTHYFVNNLALGIDAAVAAAAQRYTWLSGLPAYLAGAVHALATYKLQPLTLRFAGQTVCKPLLLATVANGRCQGGGFWLTPDARLDDGLFDLCLVEKLRPDQIIHYLPRALWGRHTHLPRVTMARAAEVEVTYTTPALVVTDGEVAATAAHHLRVELLPRALTLMG
jgi:YegS/Rv2252/BmrU family lipid kinase